MMATKRRSMSDLLREQKAAEDADVAAGESSAALTVASPPESAAARAVIPAIALPVPHAPAGTGELTASEEADLATCEQALDNLRLAFAAAGKALQVIRDARLYRASHDTFEEYAEQRWGMGKSHAYRLIEAWPLAERLSPIGERLTESHVRELLPLAGRHGQDAAATVYQTVQEADSVRVTAALLHEVVAILPLDHFDPAGAVEQIRAYLAGDIPARLAPSAADPVEAFTSETAKLAKILHRFAGGNVIREARTANPDVVRQALTELRGVLDELEREIQT
jgi:hypothetical protein